MKHNKENREKDPVNDFMIRQDQQMIDELTKELGQELLANDWGFSEIADFIEKLRGFAYTDETEDALSTEIKKWVNEAEQMTAA